MTKLIYKKSNDANTLMYNECFANNGEHFLRKSTFVTIIAFLKATLRVDTVLALNNRLAIANAVRTLLVAVTAIVILRQR